MLFDLNYKLNSDEKLISIVRKHWFLIAPRLLTFFIIISLIIIFANKINNSQFFFNVVIVLAICSLLYFIYIWVLLRIDYFIITSERIIKINQKGFWNRNLSEILISDIDNIILKEKGVAAMLFNFGSINITLENGKLFIMKDILNHIKTYQGLIKLKEIKKNNEII